MSPLPASCPACGEALAERQRWCMRCGAAAGIAIAPTPPWALLGAGAAVLALLALAGVGYALAALLAS